MTMMILKFSFQSEWEGGIEETRCSWFRQENFISMNFSIKLISKFLWKYFLNSISYTFIGNSPLLGASLRKFSLEIFHLIFFYPICEVFSILSPSIIQLGTTFSLRTETEWSFTSFNVLNMKQKDTVLQNMMLI